MIKTAIKIGILTFNTAIFLALSVAIFTIVWNYFGLEYIYGKDPIGGDYFNALTYQVFFATYSPSPLYGWLPFWNEGFPVIGGYPFLSFYLVNLLTQIYDVATAMNVFSILSLWLFFTASLLAFRIVSKNWLFTAAATALLMGTRATYNQLSTGGYVVSASGQFFLPAVLIFVSLFAQNKKIRYLIIAAVLSGIALLYHAGTSLLMVFLPSILLILVSKNLGKFTKRIHYLTVYGAIASLVGSIGLYSLALQSFKGAGTDKCTNPQCWGVYPDHLITWLSPAPPILLFGLLTVALILKIRLKSISLYAVVPPLAGLLVLVTYALLAYLRLISGAASVIPPIRTFWATNFFLLLSSAALFGSIGKSKWYIAYPLSLIIAATSLFYVYSHQPNIHKYVPNTIPEDAARYTPTKYQTKPLSEIVPDWIPRNEPNWRIDILNGGVTHWWNVAALTPQVRGYSNNPLGVHRDWQYFLQTATRGVEENTDKDLATNRALFLIDAFAVKFFENSLDAYSLEITENPDLIARQDTYFEVGTTKLLKNLGWYELQDEITTPIVSPTNTTPVLFVGSDTGFENFIRSIAMTNLNSSFLIPVKGPASIDKLSSEQLKTFPAIILYEFSGNNFGKLENFVSDGGKIFIDTGSTTSLPEKGLNQIFPFEQLIIQDAPATSQWQKGENSPFAQIDPQKFSPLSFQDGPWRITTANPNHQRQWATTYLSYQDQAVLAGGNLGKGTVVWSGLNLPFHIVSNNNMEEARLFKSALNQIIDPVKGQIPQYSVSREKPQIINIKAQNISGIYFKENYDPGWKAQVNGKNSKIYKAGLDFMYIPISNVDTETTIQISYKGSAITWILSVSTLVSLVLTIILIVAPSVLKFALAKTKTLVPRKISNKVTGLIVEEEN